MPNRLLKESICYSEDINLLDFEEEVFFYRLMVNADDYGRVDARLQMLKSRLYPLKDDISKDDINSFITKLCKIGLIVLYKNNGGTYLELLNWDKHQQIRAKRSKYPSYSDPGSELISFDINRNHIQADDINHNQLKSEDYLTNPSEIDSVTEFESNLQSSDINCNHMISDDNICPRNPIQSNPNLIKRSICPNSGSDEQKISISEESPPDERKDLDRNQNQKIGFKAPSPHDAVCLDLSRLLCDLMKLNNPSAKLPNLKSWSKSVDLMIRVDKRVPDDIAKLIRWCQKDSFWKQNILSTDKLRQKYDQLYLKMIQNNKQRDRPWNDRVPQHENFERREYSDEELEKYYVNVTS